MLDLNINYKIKDINISIDLDDKALSGRVYMFIINEKAFNPLT